MTASVRGGFASATTGAVHSDNRPDRQRKRRITFVFVAILLGALLALLLLRLGHSPKRTPLTSDRNSPLANPHGSAAPTTGLPGVICSGHHRTIARTPTKEDMKRLKRNAPKVLKQAATGKVPKLPTEITGRLLPNGTFSGTCLYGPQIPATTAPGSNY